MDIGTRVRSLFTEVFNDRVVLQMGYYKGKLLYRTLGLLCSDWELRVDPAWDYPEWFEYEDVWDGSVY